MARFDFTRMSVLVVEDSQFMRSLMVQVLKAMGVDRITVAENGEQAIALLTPVPGMKSAEMIGRTGIDLILCDWFMPTVDGGMFLRWVRRAELSPDRFLPVIMVSAAADRAVVEEARDAGMDEFLAKPFSATALANRITQAIEFPRPFVYCPTYFGPERRRRKQDAPGGNERRVTPENEIETVYSGKDLAALKNSKKKVWLFKLPKSLKKKLSIGMSQDPDEPAFDPAVLEAAEAKITSMESDYADWVADSIEELVQAHHRAIEDMTSAPMHLETIHRIALELRGQGGIFGYPLMTAFGKSLYEATFEHTTMSPQLLDLVNAHIDLIKVVIHQKIKGDGGPMGKELMTSLAKANKKFAEREA